MDSPSSNGHRWLLLITVALAVALLWYSLRGVEWRRVGEILTHARFELIAVGVGMSCSAYFLRALRWRVLLTSGGDVSIATAFWATCAGYFGNMFLPARAGEAIRTLMITARTPLTKSYVFATAFAERSSDLVFLILASPLALQAAPGKLTNASRTMTVAGIVALAMLIFIPKTERLLAWFLELVRCPEGLRAKLIGIADQVRMGVSTLHEPVRLAQFTAFTLVIWTVDVSGAVLLSYALHLSLSFAGALLLIAALGLSSAIPSTPGYVGVWQFVAVTVLAPFGFSKSDALAYILVMQVLGYLVAGGLGLLSFWKLNLSFTKRASWQQTA